MSAKKLIRLGLSLKFRLANQREPTTEEMERLMADGETTDHTEDRLCRVCLDRPKCMVLMPCMHANLCQHCVQVILRRQEDDDDYEEAKCPTCRRNIVRAAKVYDN